MMEARLPAHLEVAGLLRSVTNEGGFAVVLHKGEREAGTLLVVIQENGDNPRLYERMPAPSGDRAWTLSRRADPQNPVDFADYLARRAAQDDDLWMIELDIANGERFIGLPPPAG